jgi:hypothetical protein
VGLVDERRVLDDVGSLECDPEKEPQRSHGVIILCVTLALLPVEMTFDCPEAELERRRVLP